MVVSNEASVAPLAGIGMDVTVSNLIFNTSEECMPYDNMGLYLHIALFNT